MAQAETERGEDIVATPTLVCTEDGVFIWPGVALVERRGIRTRF
jgi:hypothetical protein